MRVWKQHLWPGLESTGYASITKYNESGEGVAIVWKKETCGPCTDRSTRLTWTFSFTLCKEKTFLFNPVAREYCGRLEQVRVVGWHTLI